MMKTFFKPHLVFFAILFLASGSVFAEPAEVFIDVNTCGLLAEFGFASGVAHEVSVNNNNNNINITCTADLEPTSTGRSIIFNYDNTGILCGAMGHPTEDWHQVISSRGKAKLTCHYKAD
jgi:hypothetical protein